MTTTARTLIRAILLNPYQDRGPKRSATRPGSRSAGTSGAARRSRGRRLLVWRQGVVDELRRRVGLRPGTPARPRRTHLPEQQAEVGDDDGDAERHQLDPAAVLARAARRRADQRQADEEAEQRGAHEQAERDAGGAGEDGGREREVDEHEADGEQRSDSAPSMPQIRPKTRISEPTGDGHRHGVAERCRSRRAPRAPRARSIAGYDIASPTARSLLVLAPSRPRSRSRS